MKNLIVPLHRCLTQIYRVELHSYSFVERNALTDKLPQWLWQISDPSKGAKDHIPVPCDDGSHQYAFPIEWQCISCLLEHTDGFNNN